MSDYINFATYKSTRGHPNKLFVNRKYSRVHGHFLFNRIVNIWNVFPSYITLIPILCALNLN